MEKGKRFKDIDFGVREDFSLQTQTARNKLRAFAKEKNTSFKPNVDKLCINDITDVYDAATDSVTQAPRSPNRKTEQPIIYNPRSNNNKPAHQPSALQVTFTNISSLMPKRDQVASLLNDSNSDIIAITETWLTPDITDNEILLVQNTCNIYRKDRMEEGVAVYFSESRKRFVICY